MTDIVDIGLAVDSRQVDKGTDALNKFGHQSGRTQKATDHLNNSLRQMRRYLLSIVSLAALRAIAQDIDRLAKVSKKLGVTTEALAGLHEAARVAGINVRTMDMALQRMVRRMAEAARGTGEAMQAIRDLGLDASKLTQLPLDKQLYAVANAFQNVKDSGEQVRLAFKLFDSEGVAMVNVLQLQAQGLDEAAQRAKDYGTAISAIDASKIEKMNDDLGGLWETFKGLGITLEVTFAPLISGLAGGLEWAISKLKEFADWYKRLVTFSFEADAAIMMMFDDWDAGVARLKKAWEDFNATAKEGGAASAEVTDKWGLSIQGQLCLWQKFGAGVREVWERIKYDASHQSTKMTGNILTDLQTMTNGLEGNSKKMFRIQKAARLAEAVVNAPAAIAQAYAAYPPPFSFIMAGIQAAAVAAQISAIRSSSFGGGGGAAVPSTSAGTVAAANQAIPVPTQQQVHAQGQPLTITHNWNIQALDGGDWIMENKSEISAAVDADLRSQGRQLP